MSKNDSNTFRVRNSYFYDSHWNSHETMHDSRFGSLWQLF